MFLFIYRLREFVNMAYSRPPSWHVSCSNVPSVPTGDPRAWFAENSCPPIDWAQARVIRRVGLTSLPFSAVPHASAPTFPRWPCLLCKVKFKTPQGVYRHVEMAHGKCHEFFRETTEFFTRCTICCKFFDKCYCLSMIEFECIF